MNIAQFTSNKSGYIISLETISILSHFLLKGITVPRLISLSVISVGRTSPYVLDSDTNHSFAL